MNRWDGFNACGRLCKEPARSIQGGSLDPLVGEQLQAAALKSSALDLPVGAELMGPGLHPLDHLLDGGRQVLAQVPEAPESP